MANMLDCDIVICEFKLWSHYNIHFWTNIFGKHDSPYPPNYGLNSITSVLLQG